MKKLFVLFSLLAIMAGTSAFAQENAGKCNKEGKECSKQCHPQLLTPKVVDMLKEEFFKENMKLENNQNEAFWKAYHKYENAQKQAKEKAKAAKEKAGIPAGHCCHAESHAKLTADQQVAIHNIQLETKQAMISAEQAFYKEIAKTLNNEQIAQYMHLEKAFQMEMMKIKGNHHDCKGGDHSPKDCSHACSKSIDNKHIEQMKMQKPEHK